MSNLGKACTLASEWVDLMGGLDNISYLYGDDVSVLIHSLDGAGLLMTDLPEPEVIHPSSRTKFWFDGDVYAHEGSGKIRVIVEDSRYPVESAREFALSILAACEYVEKERDDE